MDYTVQSRAENNTINMELPLAPLQAALKSASNGSSASLRLTKRDGDAILSLTIVTHAPASGTSANGFLRSGEFGNTFDDYNEETLDGTQSGMRETIVTQEIPIRILSASSVEGIHEPRVRDPDVHILLPPLLSLKAISDRFTKLSLATSSSTTSSSSGVRLELMANMFGTLRMRCHTDQLAIESKWEGLDNPDLDPEQMEGLNGEQHPSEIMRQRGAEAWAAVRIDGKDWGRVLSVGRLGGKVIACFVNEHALILYVYLTSSEGDVEGGEESVITVCCPIGRREEEWEEANLGSTTSHRMPRRGISRGATACGSWRATFAIQSDLLLAPAI